jgi:hypothetical protein
MEAPHLPLLRYGFMGLLVLVTLGLFALAVLRGLALRDEAELARQLEGLRPGQVTRFDPATLNGLPEPAQRYLSRAIAPGTPLVALAVLRMEGSFRLNGAVMPLAADEVLAPPQGFLWRATLGDGMQALSGSDSYFTPMQGPAQSWTRFALAGVLPVVREGGTADHARAAAGRVMIEAVWAPAALTPQAGALWRQTGPDSAEVRLPDHPDLPAVEITLDPTGLPLSARIQRWSNANPEATWRLQPFGGTFSDWDSFSGITIPVAVEMGNHFGLPEYDRFFQSRVTEARF